MERNYTRHFGNRELEAIQNCEPIRIATSKHGNFAASWAGRQSDWGSYDQAQGAAGEWQTELHALGYDVAIAED